MQRSYTEQVEEAVEGLLVPPDRGPDEATGVVVDHDGQVAVAALVGDLVDADAGEALEGVVGGPAVGDDALDDGADALPGDAQQLAHRGLGGVGDQPGHGVVEVAGVPRPVAGPGHLGHGRSVLGQFTLGESAWRKQRSVPRSSARQLRRPSPWS